MNLQFPERLKLERERAGYSVEEFGVIGGVGKASQYNYEKGARRPDIEYLANIARAGCDIQFIVTGIPSESVLQEEEAELLWLYRKVSPVVRSVAMQVLKIPKIEEI